MRPRQAPWGVVDVLDERHAAALDRGCRGGGIVGFEIEVEVFALVDEGDRGVGLVDELEVDEVGAGADAGVEVFVLEVEGEAELGGVETDRFGEVGGAELGAGAGYGHWASLPLFECAGLARLRCGRAVGIGYDAFVAGGARMARATIEAIAPFFIVSDVERTIAFYCERLGFETRFQEPEQDPFFAIVGRDGVQVFVKSDAGVAPLPNGKRHPWMKWDAFVDAPDPDALAEEFAGRGVALSASLADTNDGLRGFEVCDPDGYVLFFGRPK